jgi:predicted Zn finger-like uncharacterized protein
VIVVCQKCRTRFQLDESRLSPKGVRVRCSRCKHAFFVAPRATDDQTLHGLAAEAAASGRAGRRKPGPTVDLPGPGETDAELSRSLAAASAADEPEADWQFNIDPPGGELGDAGDATPPPAEIPDSEPTESDAVESFFEFDGLDDPGPESGEGTPVRAAKGPKATATGDADEAPASAPAPKTPIAPENEVDFEDLGNPDGWDFGLPGGAGGAAPAPKAAAPKVAAPAPAAARRRAEPAPRAERSTARAARPTDAPTPLPAIVHAAAWLLAAALFVFGVRGALAPLPAALPAETLSVGSLELAGLRVRHVENLWAGPLVVLSGELRTPGAGPAAGGRAPRVELTDAQGAALAVGPTWFGRATSEQSLRESEPEALARAQIDSARALALRGLGPNERVEVQAVIPELPAGAVGFRLEAGPPPPSAAPAASGASGDAAADGESAREAVPPDAAPDGATEPPSASSTDALPEAASEPP